MTVHHMQLIHQDQINLLQVNDDSSTSSSEAEIKANAALKTKPQVEAVSIRQNRKSVYFSDMNEYHEIEHIDDIDPEQVANTWLTRRDFTMIRASYSVTVRLMTSGRCLEESDEHCTRGLEYRTPQGSQKRQANKWNAVEAVLDEQHRQREECVNDDESLSRVYKAVGDRCQMEALERGLADAEAVSEAKTGKRKSSSPRRMSRVLMRDPNARRRAVLEDLQKMITGSSSPNVMSSYHWNTTQELKVAN